MQRRECIYISEPACFYQNVRAQLNAMRRLSETYGFWRSCRTISRFRSIILIYKRMRTLFLETAQTV